MISLMISSSQGKDKDFQL